MVELRTYQTLAANTEPTAATTGSAKTTWVYSAARGSLTRKQYADGKGTDYTYTASGRIATRTWARSSVASPKVTTYTYDAGMMVSTNYSDTTPDVTVTYDNFGRPITQSNGLATSTFAYDPTTLAPDTETIAYDLDTNGTPELTRVLDRSQDNLNRDTGWQLKAGATIENKAAYSYSATDGRISSISNPQLSNVSFAYSYVANSNLIATVTGPAHTVTNGYETTRDVLASKVNKKLDTTTLSSYFYTVNNFGQRTVVNKGGTAFASARGITWGYNNKGEVVKADSTIPGLDRAYLFDQIGSRLKTADSLTLPATNNYTSNALNQYTAVNSLNPTHDDDGNMTSGPLPANVNANSTLVWDCENRLIQAQVTGGGTVTYLYDSQSRRIAETIGTATKITLHDGWNPIAEYGSAGFQPASLAKSFTWGVDLSGSMQGAGGVGGLLAVHDGTATYFPTYDGNGNVSEYLNSTGAVVAHYEYDPFGRTTVATGTKANDFAHRFSTKPLDATTGLYYYGYRWYDPYTGRWPSRDPIGERGGINLYAFVGNDGLSSWDKLGLWDGPDRDSSKDKAPACAEKGDTWESLAEKIGLSAGEVDKWLTTPDAQAGTATPEAGKTYFVPNVIVSYWGGDWGSGGRTMVAQEARNQTLEGREYMVMRRQHQTNWWKNPDTNSHEEHFRGSADLELQTLLEGGTLGRKVHGMFFTGHGSDLGLHASEDGSKKDLLGRATYTQWQVEYSSINLRYKLGLVWSYACRANKGKPSLFSNAPGSEWKPDVDGTLVPLPFGGCIDWNF